MGLAIAQNPQAGRSNYEGRCVSCHGGEGAGGEHGPAIVGQLGTHSDEALATIIGKGLPNRGMPAFKLNAEEMLNEVAQLFVQRQGCTIHTLASKSNASAPAPGNTLVKVAQEVDFLLTGLGD